MKLCDFCFLIFYFILNFLTIASLCTFSKDFFTRFSYTYLITFFTCLFTSYYLFMTVKRDPGIIAKKEEEMSLNLSTAEINTNSAAENIAITQSINAEPIDKSFEKMCDKCSVEIPLRGKHCSRCGVCVRKFDHHCFMVGGCVGEKNHFKFYLYLLAQTITLFLAIFAILDTVSFYLDITDEKYTKVPIILYFLLIFLAGYCLMTTILLLFHTYLILTNQTTYEIYHRTDISYLSKFKEMKKVKMQNLNLKVPGSMPFHPFDMGFKENFNMVYHGNRE